LALSASKEIQAAWAVKERLRLLLAEHQPSKIRWRLADFYEAAIDARLPKRLGSPARSRLGGRQPDSSSRRCRQCLH
jgi:hypothetical protein